MGKFAIKPLVQFAAILVAIILVYLNIKMLINEVMPFFMNEAILPKIIIIILGVFFGAILIYISIFPFIKKRKPKIQ